MCKTFYWAVTSTKEYLGEVKLAKFEAFMCHVVNKHKDLPNRIFNACAHGTITNPRVWMTKGTTVIVNICLHCKINVPAYLMSDHNTIKHDALLCCDGTQTHSYYIGVHSSVNAL